jgi:hypothetical protein
METANHMTNAAKSTKPAFQLGRSFETTSAKQTSPTLPAAPQRQTPPAGLV